MGNHTDSTTELLIRQCRAGDARAQRRLFDKYVKAMYNTVLRIVSEQMEAEDIVQEGFIKAFAKLSQYRAEANFGGWLKRIMVNLALSHLSRTPQFADMELLSENLPDPTTQAEDHLEEMPSIAQVHAQVKQLPEGCRVVFTLYLIEGYEQREVAEMLGVSISTVKTQYRRARLLLKDRLKAMNYER